MTYNTYFYEPLSTQDAIEKSVHWALGLPGSFLVSVGDMGLLPRMLDAAARFERSPGDTEMEALVEKYDIRPVFTQAPRREGRNTWGGMASHYLESLVREGFFDHPRKRTLAQVIKAFESRGIGTSGKKGNIATLLAVRVRKGILRKKKGEEGWAYWK